VGAAAAAIVALVRAGAAAALAAATVLLGRLRCRRSPSLPFLLLLGSDPYDRYLLGSFSSDPLRLTRSEEAVNPAPSGSGTHAYLDFLGEGSESLEFRPRDWEREWLREPRSSSSSEVSLERLLLLRGMRPPTTKRRASTSTSNVQ